MASGDDLAGAVLLTASPVLFIFPKRFGVLGLAGKSAELRLAFWGTEANNEGPDAAVVAGVDGAAGVVLFTGGCGLLKVEESTGLAPNKFSGVVAAGLGVCPDPNKESLLLACFAGWLADGTPNANVVFGVFEASALPLFAVGFPNKLLPVTELLGVAPNGPGFVVGAGVADGFVLEVDPTGVVLLVFPNILEVPVLVLPPKMLEVVEFVVPAAGVMALPKMDFGAEGVVLTVLPPPKRGVELEGGFALLAPPELFDKAGGLNLKEDETGLAGLV